ncbi:hypothetical protein O0L34_g10841 [Tuta absoluta]|nr:hypothetical protein O0L34_g10841 [Tuta absoluta]
MTPNLANGQPKEQIPMRPLIFNGESEKIYQVLDNQKSNYPEMLGQIGLAFGCVNYLSTASDSANAGAKLPGNASRQKVHPEDATSSREKLALPRKASPDENTPSPNAFETTIQPKISPLLASDCTPTTDSKTMTLYGYNAAAKLPFAFSHARPGGGGAGAVACARAVSERRSLRAVKPIVTGRMVRSASSGAAGTHAPPPAPLVERSRPHSPGGDSITRGGVVSLPGSPRSVASGLPVVGSAESLVTRVLAEQGLGAYCDAEFVRNTSREMQEALEMTQEQMDRAAHQLMVQESKIKQAANQPPVGTIWTVIGRHPSSPVPPFPPAVINAPAPAGEAVIAPPGTPDTATRHRRKRKPVLV